MDRAIGGVGMRRGRRHSLDVRVGDAIDFWRVVRVESGRRLVLLAEMRLPGTASLELEVQSVGPQRSALTTTARFHPAGALGLLYWYVLWPVHGPLFRGMTSAICQAAEAASGTADRKHST
jgi:hypothetical protein